MTDKDFLFDMAEANGAVARRTPLHGYNPIAIGSVELQECECLGKVIIRGSLSDNNFCRKVQEVCGLPVPATCSFTRRGEGEGEGLGEGLLWLSPDELLFYCPPRQVFGVMNVLRDSFSGMPGMHGSVVEVSDYYTVLRLRGGGSVDLLAGEMVIDLRLREFAVGGCVGTIYGNAQVVVCRLAEDDFLVQVRWSFADYLWRHLAGGMEFL